MKLLGLKMHTGIGKKSSKTEAVYFSSRSKIQSWIKNNEENLLPLKSPSPLDLIVKTKKKSLRNMKHIIDRQYSIVPEIENFSLDENRFISFTPNFRYLGSWISYDQIYRLKNTKSKPS